MVHVGFCGAFLSSPLAFCEGLVCMVYVWDCTNDIVYFFVPYSHTFKMFSSTGFMQINDHHHHHHHNHYYYYSSPSALSGPAKSNIGCWDVWKT